MPTTNSDRFGAGVSVLTASSHYAITRLCTVAIAAAAAALTDGDLLNLCVIPAGHQVVDLKLFCGDLDADGSPALTFDVGLMDDGDTALDTIFVADTTLGQAGGTLAVPATAIMFGTAAAATDKVLAIEVKTTAATKHAAARTIGCVVSYVPSI